MKKIKIVTGIFFTSLLLSSALHAQDTVKTIIYEKKEVREENPFHPVELGFHVLPMFTSLKLNTYNGETVTGTATASWGYGGLIGINFSPYIGVQGEVNYNPISQKYTDRGIERTVAINYLDVPILLSLNTGKNKPVNFNIVLGPQLGINAGSSIKSSGQTNGTDQLQAVVAVKQTDVGAAYGAGLEFALDPSRMIKLELGFRGMYGLVNMNATPAGENTYNVLVNGSRKSYGGYAGVRIAF